MGGPAAPSIGFGAGIERLLLACDAEGVLPAPSARVDAFVVDLVGTPDAALVLSELREAGIAADRAYGGRAARRQFGAADRAGAKWAVVIGAREAEQGMVAVRDLRSGEQVEVKRKEVAAWLAAKKDEAPR
jgi:histidyl-tRNA synthetase